MIRRIILFLLLFSTWLVLSGYFEPFFMAVGAGSCALAVLLYAKMYRKEDGRLGNAVLLLRVPVYFFWLLKEIVVSSFDVAEKMWQIEPDISPGIEWVPTPIRGDIGLTVYANSITLTPGTVATMVRDNGMIQVHSLNREGLESLREGGMGNKIAKLIDGAA